MSDQDGVENADTDDEVAQIIAEADESEPQEGADTDDESADDGETFDAARALAKIRKANSEAKTQRERAKAAEEKAKGLEPAVRDAALQRVARRLQLPDNEQVDSFLSRLQGDTVDELAEDAERLLSLIAPKDNKPPATRPKEQLRGGGAPQDDPEPDPDKLAEQILGRRGY